MKKTVLTLSLFVLCWYSCKSANLSKLSEVNDAPLPPRFINKIVTMMQNGHPVPPSGEILIYEGTGVKKINFKDLVGKNANQVFDIMSKSVHFADTLLQYNLYFLGRSTDVIKQPSNYIEPNEANPNGANPNAPPQNIYEGPESPTLTLVQEGTVVPEDSEAPEVSEQSSPQPIVEEAPEPLRENIRYTYPRDILNYPQAVHSAYETFRGGDFFTLFSAMPATFIEWPSRNEADELKAVIQRLKDSIYQATLQGSASNICNSLVRQGTVNSITPALRAFREAVQNSIPDCQTVTNVNEMKSYANKMTQIADFIYSERMKYLNNAPDQFLSLADYQMIPAIANSPIQLTKPISFETWANLPNTQTNANRKRASYLLKTYFCDDILPVKIEVNEMNKHSKNKHLSDPACASCHYKLDPIGGLFRYHGAGGMDFSKRPPGNGFPFDGGGFMTATGYRDYLQKNWPRDINGTVKLGYYTSPDKRHPQWQGDTLEDFWNFLPKTEKVKQCYVQRLTESILGREQAVDENWINALAQRLQPGPNSGKQLLGVLKEIYFSNANREPERDANVCYDRINADNKLDFIPCKIQSILNKNCKSCHSDDANSLNIQSIVGGEKPWFKHAGMNGIKDSASEILSRLNESDKDLVMPQGALQLTDTEKGLLQTWLIQNGASIQ